MVQRCCVHMAGALTDCEWQTDEHGMNILLDGLGGDPGTASAGPLQLNQLEELVDDLHGVEVVDAKCFERQHCHSPKVILRDISHKVLQVAGALGPGMADGLIDHQVHGQWPAQKCK